MSAFNPTQRQIWRRNLRESLNLDDLKSISFELDVEYEDLAGETKSEKVNSLLETLFRTNRLDQFRSYLIEHEDYGHVVLPGLGELVGESPYVGLSAFSEENAHNFYGREAFVSQLENGIQKQPFVPVLGPSGSGKSSLIFAGLFPKVRPMPDWMVLNTRPGADVSPLHSLVAAFLNPAMQDRLPHERRKAINDATKQVLAGELTPMELVTDLVQQNEKVDNVLLYIDQFEELFTADVALPKEDDGHAKTNEFLEHLVPLIKSTSKRVRLVVLITMRADFLGFALGHPALADLLNHHDDIKLRPLKIERDPENEDELSEMERVIILPAKNAGASFQEGVVERIIEDVAKGAGNLPLLQFALTELWNVQESGILTHQGYDFIGQADGALVNHAEAIFEELSTAEKKLARQLFVQLVQPGRGTTDTRRIANRGELSDDVWQLAQKLSGEEARLIYANSDATQRETVQVTHEALIANWQRLKDWMDEDRAFREWQEQFRADVALWLGSDHPDDFLYQGARLAQSNEQIRVRRPNLQDDEQRFIDASQDAAEAEARAKELARQQELEQAQQLAEAQERELVAQKRRGQITRIALGVISVLLVASAWAGFSAYRNGQTAVAQSLRAQTQALMSLSTTTLPEHINPSVEQAELAILMGVQAIRNNDAQNGELLTSTFVNQQMRTLMAELEKPTWTPLPVGDTALFPGDFALYKDVSITADGRYVAAAEEFGYIYLWDLTQPGQDPVIFDTEYNESTDYQVAIAPDGSFFVTFDNATGIGIWDPNNNQDPIVVLEGHEDLVYLVNLSPDGRLLATADWSGTIHIWNVEDLNNIGDPIATLAEEQGISALDFSPDGQTLYVGNFADELIGWNVTVSEEKRFTLQIPDVVYSFERSPSNETIAIGGSQGAVYLISPPSSGVGFESGEFDLVELGGQVSFSNDVLFSADGNKLAAVNDDKSVFVWNLKNLDEPPTRLQGHSDVARSAVFLPGGDQLISSAFDNPLFLWQLNTPITSPQILEAPDWGQQVAWSPDGEQLAASYADGTAELISVSNPTDRTILDGAEGARRPDILYSPDGRWLVSVFEGAQIQVQDTANNLAVVTNLITENIDYLVDLAYATFTPDGNSFVASIEGSLYVWSVSNWSTDPTEIPIDLENGISSFAISADGAQIAVAPGDGFYEIHIYDFPQVDLSQPSQILSGHVHFLNALAFSADGKWLASGSNFSKIRIWDLENPDSEPVLLEDHQGLIWSLDFAPDSQHLVSASDDNTVRIWDATDWSAESQLLEGHQALVWSAAFSPDSKYIASTSADKTVRIWPTLDTLVELACDRVTRNMTQAEWDRFLSGQPYQQTCPALPAAGAN